VFPDACLVVAARDIRSTVASLKRLWESNYRKLGVRFYLPEDSGYCWSVSPPASARDWPAERTFPGGKVSVLAEYWLRTYEIIDRTVAGFDAAVLVKHGEFIRDPEQSLRRMFRELGLGDDFETELPVQIDVTRNERWRDTLTSGESDELEAFIATHRQRIERLTYVDMTKV